MHVNEIGLCPTPLLYFSCFELSAKGGIIVTGSHNPKNHNGFKIVLENMPFFGKDLLGISKDAKGFEYREFAGSLTSQDLEKNIFQGFYKTSIKKKK